ncbi:hypothetical protein Ndes2526B_g08786 [Nannochloris sp. 'desiccata']|nr:hypothetical protein KSW81_001645 [Chlorella desiccata (nom. nud.)]KAH7616689.1 putative Transmembrane protein 184C [Chlorella desiccata (nom. nud.)]
MLGRALCGIPVRRVIRAVWVLLAVCTLSALPWMIIEFKKAQFSVHYQAWFIAGIFVILAVSASIYEVAMHLENYNRPKLQIRVVRILWMVPIYAVDSWLSLRFKEARFYIDPIRECYEAFVIYNFFMYLVAYLEDEYGDVVAYYSTKEQVPHIWPITRCLRPWRMGEEFFWETKRGVLSYVIARPLMTAVSVTSNLRGNYCDGEFKSGCAYPYVAFVNNCSQMWALYCLVLLYNATKRELAPINPLPKFIAIKAVVFLTFWQALGIEIAAHIGLIKPAELSTYDTDDLAAGLQNFLICLEMFFAAILHAYAFPPRDYMDPSVPSAGFLNNIRVMFDVGDVVTDVHGLVSDTLQETQDNINEVRRKARDTAVDFVSKPLSLIGFNHTSSCSSSRKKDSNDGRGGDGNDRGSNVGIRDIADEEYGGEGRALLDFSPQKSSGAGLSSGGGSGGGRHR